jgi:hypothetical protein
MCEALAFAYRERALQAHKKAMRAGIPEETRRAWLIVERDWTRMADQEAVNLDDAVPRHRGEILGRAPPAEPPG